MSDHLNRRVTKLEEKITHLDRISAPGQQNEAGVEPQQTRANESNAAPRQMPSQPHIPATPENSVDAEQPWYKTIKGWNTIVQMLAVPFVIWYAVVTHIQWTDLRHNFRVDQRAWVSVRQVDWMTKDLMVGTVPEFKLTFFNTGKTPAQYLISKSTAFVRTTDDLPEFDPNGLDGTPSPIDIAPNADTMVFSHAHGPISQLDAIGLSSGKLTLYCWGRVTYKDIFDKPHATTFCFALSGTILKPGAVEGCTKYNTIN